MTKQPKPNGRPTLYDAEKLLSTELKEYTPHMIPLVARMAALGCTDDEIAVWFGIGVKTFRKWVMIHEELSAALKPGKAIADDMVERSLFMQAVGYTVEEEKAFCSEGVIIKDTIKTYIKPSTSAQIFWLKNRRSDVWRDVQKHEHGAAGEFDNLTDEQIAERLAQIVGQQPPEQPVPRRSKRGDKLN